MYIYFDNRGTLKEIINDSAIRQGNADINTIYFFIEGQEPQVDSNGVYQALTFIKGLYTFVDEDGELLTTQDVDFSATPVEKEIPYDKKRELKHFQYFTKYEMFQLSLPNELLNFNGTVACSLRMVVSTTPDVILTLGLLVFNIEGNGTKVIIDADTGITLANWNYLVSNMLTRDTVNMEALRDIIQTVLFANTDSALSDTSTNPVQNKVVKQAIDSAVSGVYKIQGTETVSNLNSLTKDASINGYVYNMSDAGSLTNEDESTTQVQVGDNVVFIWDEGDWYWDKMAGIVDTSNLVTLDSTQTISGNKTFTGTTTVTGSLTNGTDSTTVANLTSNLATPYSSSSTYALGDIVNHGGILYKCTTAISTAESWDSTHWTKLEMSDYCTLSTDQTITGVKIVNNQLIFKNSSSSLYWRINPDQSGNFVVQYSTDQINWNYSGWFNTTSLYTVNHNPRSNNSYDLGTNGTAWKDLYLSGNINLKNADASYGYTISESAYSNLNISYNGTQLFAINNTNGIVSNNNFLPYTSATYDLGSSTYKWKDLYLSGAAKTNSITRLSGNALVFSSGTNVTNMGDFSTRFAKDILPVLNTTVNLGGPNGYEFNNLTLKGHILGGNNSSYGLALPDTTGWTANKTIATTDQITSSGLFRHSIAVSSFASDESLEIITSSNTAISTLSQLESAWLNKVNAYFKKGDSLAGYSYYSLRRIVLRIGINDLLIDFYMIQNNSYPENKQITLTSSVTLTDTITAI